MQARCELSENTEVISTINRLSQQVDQQRDLTLVKTNRAFDEVKKEFNGALELRRAGALRSVKNAAIRQNGCIAETRERLQQCGKVCICMQRPSAISLISKGTLPEQTLLDFSAGDCLDRTGRLGLHEEREIRRHGPEHRF